MPVPSTQDIRRALLEILKVGNPQSITAKKWRTLAAEHLGMSIQDQESKEFNDRITKSLQYLIDQHMISKPSRYLYMITKKGQILLEDKPEIPDEELETLPDDLDFTEDEPEASEEPEASDEPDSSDSELEALPDNLDLTNDEPKASEEPEASSEPDSSDSELEALPDDLDLTEDEPDIPEIPDTIAEDSDSFTESPDIQDSQQNIDTDTLNSIDEVEPDMPKDDLPADNFSTTDTEDFSSAVNQALSIDDVFERHNSELADKVLMRAASLSQDMFAVFVTDLLSKMGYNAFQTARYSPNSSGDSMIQGVILDPKAKSPIYIHADKLSPGRTVGRSDMHDFADELAEKGGTGIFATTGDFSEQAGIYAQDERIMLIDGKKLAGLILANNFCVNVAKVFEVKELDDDSFREYE